MKWNENFIFLNVEIKKTICRENNVILAAKTKTTKTKKKSRNYCEDFLDPQ